MIDREKVINDLNVAKLMLCNPQVLTPDMCVKIGQAISATIALLKEQEAVEPRRIDGKRNHFIKCGNCNYDLIQGFQFCPYCGKPVKWNDID